MKPEVNPTEPEVHQLVVNSNQFNSVRTYIIFLDLPKHLELRINDIPLLQTNDVMEFDLNLKDPRNMNKTWKVTGSYFVSKRILKYCSDSSKKSGLTQYLEFKPVEINRPDS